jgi:sugar-specific transcriptional regulator TrmB
VEPSLVDQLTRLGLTSYEARAYVALTGRGRATAAEIARLAALPRQRIYDVVETLVERGFAVARPGRPLLYSAVAPDEALERLLGERRNQLAQLERETQDAIERLTPTFHAGRGETDPLDYIEVLREPGAIATRFAELQAAVESEILVFTKPPYATPPAENVEGLRLLQKHSARSVYERSVFDHPEHVAAIRKFIDTGEHARVVERLPIKLAIVDERIAVFQMQDPVAGAEGLTIMIVEHPSLAELLKIAFEAVWESADEFEDAAARA